MGLGWPDRVSGQAIWFSTRTIQRIGKQFQSQAENTYGQDLEHREKILGHLEGGSVTWRENEHQSTGTGDGASEDWRLPMLARHLEEIENQTNGEIV